MHADSLVNDESNKFHEDETSKVKQTLERLTYKIFIVQQINGDIEPRMMAIEQDWAIKRDLL